MNYTIAKEFLKYFGGCSHPLSFQTFPDKPTTKKSLTKIYHGSYENQKVRLYDLNKKGAGIFFTVNETDGNGRKKENITKVRALFADFDKTDKKRFDRLKNLDYPPTIIVESSKDKHHAYWVVTDDGIHVDEFTEVQAALLSYLEQNGFKPDPAVKDIARVLRLPGSWHKKKEEFLTQVPFYGQKYDSCTLKGWLKPYIKTHTLIKIPPLSPEQIRNIAKNDWMDIFRHLGFEISQNPKEHSTCPACGGKDRFRFDNLDGKGTYICSQGTGDEVSGDGLSFFIDHVGWGLKKSVLKVTEALIALKLIDSNGTPLKSIEFSWSAPEDLHTVNSSETPYPVDAWSDSFQHVINNIAEAVQVPVSMVGQCLLGAMAHIAQSHINCPLRDGNMPVSLFLITESPSGSGKSSTMSITHKAIFESEESNYSAYLCELCSWEDNRNELNGKDKKEYEKNHPKPINPNSLFEDITIESLLDKFIEDEVINASLSSDEAGLFFGGYSMKSDTSSMALSSLTKLYDIGKVNRTRSKKNAFATDKTNAYNKRLSLCLMGQKTILHEVMTNQLMNEQGFLPRSTFAFPDSLMGKRDIAKKKRQIELLKKNDDILNYWSICKRLISKKSNGTRTSIQFENAKAEDTFFRELQIIENKMSKGGEFQHYQSYASRMGENACRIAAIMVFFDGRDTITDNDISRAFKLVYYSMRERIRYSQTGSDIYNNSIKLSEWLVEKSQNINPPKLNRTFVLNNAPSPMRNTKILQVELDKLESSGHLIQEKEGRKKVIYVNPVLLL